MRVLMTSAFGLLALASMSIVVEAAPCPPGMATVCEPTPLNRPPQCHCERTGTGPTGGSGTGGAGKAEIHKKNVPTVKPNKSPGSNN